MKQIEKFSKESKQPKFSCVRTVIGKAHIKGKPGQSSITYTNSLKVQGFYRTKLLLVQDQLLSTKKTF